MTVATPAEAAALSYVKAQFGSRVAIKDPAKCWIWTGARNYRNGYGRVKLLGKQRLVHRMVFEAVVGAVPPGREIDHLCRTKLCVNPFHLEAVTHMENVLRGVSPVALGAKRSECMYGHPLDGTKIRALGIVHRFCRTCQRQANAKHGKRRRAERQAARAAISKAEGRS